MFIGFTGHAFDSETEFKLKKEKLMILMDITSNWHLFSSRASKSLCLDC